MTGGTTAHGESLLHGDITREIIGAFFDVYNGLGHGFLEVVYRRAMAVALAKRGIEALQEVPFSVYFAGETVGDYRADLVVARRVIVECKATERLTGTHEAQLLNYLRASGLNIGIALNFGPRATFRRMARSSPKQ